MSSRHARALVGLLALAAACQQSSSDAATRPASGAAPAAASTPAAPTPPAGDSALLARADAGRIKGSASAPLWIIEVSDFQCPYCKMWHDSSYAAVVREYVETGKARLAFINFPLGNHQHAVPAAEAAMCASPAGKFWEVHSAIFDAQERWSGLPDAAAHFDSLASRAGVPMEAWRECMRSDVMLPLIAADRERGAAAGVSSTPSFLIGNEAIRGVVPLSTFRATIERALQGATARR